MDDLSISGEELNENLREIAFVNKWLGGHQVILKGLKPILFNFQKNNIPIRIVDIGCGGGDTLAAIGKWCAKNKLKVKLIGVDANPHILDFAQEVTQSLPSITYQQANILRNTNFLQPNDIVLCSLFLHHFTENEQQTFISKCQKANVGVIFINDIHRHWLAYALFQLVCFILRASRMTIEDGLLSIKKGFKKPELEQLMQAVNIKNYTLNWKWAFRFQLITKLNDATKDSINRY